MLTNEKQKCIMLSTMKETMDMLNNMKITLLLVLPGGNDNVLSHLPVDRGCDLLFRGQLEAVYDPQDLTHVPSSGGRVEDGQLQLLVRTDDEHRTGSQGHAL